jgi:hypothetical protein
MGKDKQTIFLQVLVALTFSACQASAVLFYSTADPEYNATPPSGTLAGSGWELQGYWGDFLGTPVSARHFLTARHVGGVVGDTFLFQGHSYRTTAVFDDPSSDLRLWQVDAAFPAYAPLYSRSDEVGRKLVVFGRGTQRGLDVSVTAHGALRLRGWQWGTADGRLRWGENQVDSVVNGEAGSGDLLKVLFHTGGGANEAHLSGGDSGGAVFVQDGATWKLAGINYGAEGLYSLSKGGPGFDAALFDQGGVYNAQGTNWVLIPYAPFARPGAFYATRVSPHVAWIQSIVAQTNVQGSVALQSASNPAGVYTDETEAQTDVAAGTITIAVPSTSRFYRMVSAAPTTITRVTVSARSLILSFVVSPTLNSEP